VKKSWHHIKTILAYIWRSSPGWTLSNAMLILIRGVLPLMLLYMIKLLVDEISLVATLPLEERDFVRLKWILVASGILFLVNAISASVGSLVREKQSYVITDFFDDLIHNKIPDWNMVILSIPIIRMCFIVR
jgi:ATP-binding cassette, subfamily B, bacterial